MKRASEIRPVDGTMARRFRVVNILTPGAVQTDGAQVGEVVLTHGEQWVLFTHDARTFAEVAFFILLKLFGDRH